MIARYALHAGTGREWQIDSTLPDHEVEVHDDWRELRRRAQQELQQKFDWWVVFDLDEGMSHVCGWSTGRTTRNLVEADSAISLLR